MATGTFTYAGIEIKYTSHIVELHEGNETAYALQIEVEDIYNLDCSETYTIKVSDFYGVNSWDFEVLDYDDFDEDELETLQEEFEEIKSWHKDIKNNIDVITNELLTETFNHGDTFIDTIKEIIDNDYEDIIDYLEEDEDRVHSFSEGTTEEQKKEILEMGFHNEYFSVRCVEAFEKGLIPISVSDCYDNGWVTEYHHVKIDNKLYKLYFLQPDSNKQYNKCVSKKLLNFFNENSVV